MYTFVSVKISVYGHTQTDRGTYIHSASVVLVKRLHFYSWFFDSENNLGLVQFESPVLTVVLVSYSFNY